LKVWIRRYGLAYAEFFSHGQLPARRERGKNWGVETARH
jgi:hypothetical protein